MRRGPPPARGDLLQGGPLAYIFPDGGRALVERQDTIFGQVKEQHAAGMCELDHRVMRNKSLGMSRHSFHWTSLLLPSESSDPRTSRSEGSHRREQLVVGSLATITYLSPPVFLPKRAEFSHTSQSVLPGASLARTPGPAQAAATLHKTKKCGRLSSRDRLPARTGLCGGPGTHRHPLQWLFFREPGERKGRVLC